MNLLNFSAQFPDEASCKAKWKEYRDRQGVVRVEQVVAFLLPHRPGRADFPHPVPLIPVSLKENCDRFWVSTKAAIG
jgi:hypothetical protein